MGEIHFSKLLIFALIITVSFIYAPQAQAKGVVNIAVAVVNVVINTVVGITAIAIGYIPGLGIVGDDGRCRLAKAYGNPAKFYYDECDEGGGGSSSGGNSGSGSGSGDCGTSGCNGCVSGGNCTAACQRLGFGSVGWCAVPGSTNPEVCCGCGNSCPVTSQLPLPITPLPPPIAPLPPPIAPLPPVNISVCSGVFCVSTSCDPNVQTCLNQCGSKYDCGYRDPQVIIQPIGEVVVPDPLRISWSSSYTSSCTANSDPNVWSGAKGTSGSENIFNPTSVSQRGTYNFTLSCSGAWDSATAVDSKSATIISVPRCSFLADPSSIVLPEKSTLSWNCSYASECSISDIGSVDAVSGSVEVSPSETTTYTLNCVGLDGSRAQVVTVTNAFEPIIEEVIPR